MTDVTRSASAPGSTGRIDRLADLTGETERTFLGAGIPDAPPLGGVVQLDELADLGRTGVRAFRHSRWVIAKLFGKHRK